MGHNKIGLLSFSVCDLIMDFISMLNIWVMKHADTWMHGQTYHIPIICPLYIHNVLYLAAVDFKIPCNMRLWPGL
jgi:hypothetical protein